MSKKTEQELRAARELAKKYNVSPEQVVRLVRQRGLEAAEQHLKLQLLMQKSA